MLSVIVEAYREAQIEQERTRKSILDDPVRGGLFHDHLDLRDMGMATISDEKARRMCYAPTSEEEKILSMLYPWKKATKSVLNRISI